MEGRLKPAMLDPSILCTVDFWKTTRNLKRVFPVIYVPESIKQLEDIEFRKFYGGRLLTEKILSVEEVIKRSREVFKSFSWKEYSEEIPEQFRVGFGNLRRGLEKSYLAKSIQNVFLDEFVFLTTQSSILSRMKKIFKVFETLNVFPLLNFEKRAPEEWKDIVHGVKKAVSIINWIGFIGGYSLIFPFPISPLVGGVVKGIRLILVDP